MAINSPYLQIKRIACSLLGDVSGNYSETTINDMIEIVVSEIEIYCNREIDQSLVYTAARIVVLRLLRLGTDGLSSQSYSGISESFIDGLPADIQAILNQKRKVRFI